MDSNQSIHNLTESIHGLLGFKANLTSRWADLVCDTVKNKSSDEFLADSKAVESTSSSDTDSGSEIMKFKDEIATLGACITQLNIQRKQVLHEFLDLKGNIRVYCRVRPTATVEHISFSGPVETMGSNRVQLKFTDKKNKIFTFDKVFHAASSQGNLINILTDEVFSEIEPVIKSALDGSNACVFAYGQTGAGKTFTMEGTPECPGVVPRAIELLFKQAKDCNRAFLFGFSMLEIYMGNLKDLLMPLSATTTVMPPCLAIQTDPKGGTEIKNLVTIHASDFEKALMLYKLGCQFRSTVSTNSNATPSRSHCMLRVSITCYNAPERKRGTSKIWMVDLGGSERLPKTKAWGTGLEEGKAINLSLSALEDVISALQRKAHHIPYRNSKLTRVLKDSLGENSKTLIFVHISPEEDDLCETVCSLNFATRLRSIHLADEKSIEAKWEKEVLMTDLQKKMTRIEEERQFLRTKIEKSNTILSSLNGEASSAIKLQDASHLSIEAPQCDKDDMDNRLRNIKAFPLSQTASFMRPTFSSRKKIGRESNISEGIFTAPRRWRRSRLPHRAKSEIAHARVISEYNSECSRASRETSELDVKTDVFIEHAISQKGASRQISHYIASRGNWNKTQKVEFTNFMKVEEWLRHKNEHINHINWSRGVPPIPTPEKKKKHALNKAGAVNKSTSDLEMGRVAGPLKDFSEEDSNKSNSIYHQSCNGDDTKMIQTQHLAASIPIEDNKSSVISPLNKRPGSGPGFSDGDCCGESVTSTLHEVAEETDSPSSKYSCTQFTSSSIENDIRRQIGKSDPCTPVSEQASNHHMPESLYKAMEVNGNEDLHDSSPQLQEEVRISLHKVTNALYTDSANKDGVAISPPIPQGNQQTSGTHDLIQRVKILCAGILLGLGFQDLGLDHDFFHGLML